MKQLVFTAKDREHLLYLRGDLPKWKMEAIRKRIAEDAHFQAELFGFEKIIINCGLNVYDGMLKISKALVQQKHNSLVNLILNLCQKESDPFNEGPITKALRQDFKNYLIGAERIELEEEKNRRKDIEEQYMKLMKKYRQACKDQEDLYRMKKELENENKVLKVKSNRSETCLYKKKRVKKFAAIASNPMRSHMVNSDNSPRDMHPKFSSMTMH